MPVFLKYEYFENSSFRHSSHVFPSAIQTIMCMPFCNGITIIKELVFLHFLLYIKRMSLKPLVRHANSGLLGQVTTITALPLVML